MDFCLPFKTNYFTSSNSTKEIHIGQLIMSLVMCNKMFFIYFPFYFEV